MVYLGHKYFKEKVFVSNHKLLEAFIGGNLISAFLFLDYWKGGRDET